MRFLLAVAFVIALIPAGVAAQQPDPGDDGDFTLRIQADYTVEPGETLSTLLVIDADVVVEGTITDALIVINGTGTLASGAEVEGDITVISGELVLEPDSTAGDIQLIDSELDQAEGATVTGHIDRSDQVFWFGWTTFLIVGFFFWLGMTIVVLVAGALFALVGGRQLVTMTNYMSDRVGQCILSGIVAAIALPLVAVLLMVTVVGIPVGLGILLFLIPALLFLGYLVTGTWLGALILSRTAPQLADRPVGPALLGLLILQVILLIPGLGWIVFPVAGIWGTGALVYYLWLNLTGRGQPVAAPVA